MFGRGGVSRAALNLGGIANLTILTPGGEPTAFDVGPANALIDAAVTYVTGSAESIDRDGRRAARGRVHKGLLRRFAEDPYFGLEPPKSTGKEHFNLPYLLDALDGSGEVEADDLVATVTALTAETVGDDLCRYGVEEVVVSGGGARNPTLMRALRQAAPNTRVRSIEEWRISSEAKEAYAFAVLGFLLLHGLPGTLPGCTGAGRAAMLGSITPGREPLALPPPAEEEPLQLIVEAVVDGRL